jgi:positive regulator of sigma E activity
VFALCTIVMMVCCTVVQYTFHNDVATLLLAGAMGISSGVLVARDARMQRQAEAEEWARINTELERRQREQQGD